jgi:hypothetical protein
MEIYAPVSRNNGVVVKGEFKVACFLYGKLEGWKLATMT